jgi:hypothetical protein
VNAAIFFENRTVAFQSVVAEKVAEYEDLEAELVTQHVSEVSVVPLIIG